jgi:formyl-CoA transferase
VAALQAASVPVGRIYTVKDIAEDPHYRARGMIQDAVTPDGLPLKVPGVVPLLSATPGRVEPHAPTLGEHTDAVLGRLQGRGSAR